MESLGHTLKYLQHSAEGRYFMEKYMTQIVGILVDQYPSKIGSHEKDCVQDSLYLAIQIVALDLQLQNSSQSQTAQQPHCRVLKTLEHSFNRRRNYYSPKKLTNNQSSWAAQHHANNNNSATATTAGLPELRIRLIHKFRQCNGFTAIAQYIQNQTHKLPQPSAASLATDQYLPLFLELDALRQIILAAADIIPRQQQQQQQQSSTNTNSPKPNQQTHALQQPKPTVLSNDPNSEQQRIEIENDVIALGDAIMEYITHLSDDDLKKIPVDQLSNLQQDLQIVFDRLATTRRQTTYKFYAYWRQLVYKFLSSPSLPLKLHGWEAVNDLIDACERHRPPPRTFWVQGAGCKFANGLYEYHGPVTPDGYYKPTSEIMYVRAIPHTDPEQGGHKLTLFRCTMRSQQKWWFLSEADEEQPGTDRDIDYYQHKAASKDLEEPYPPRKGWITCRTSGIDPPPTMQAIGWMVPPGQERNTLEHQLAKWAIEQKIVEQVLGDTTSHREVVARSTTLINFLAQMCSREDHVLPRVPDHLLTTAATTTTPQPPVSPVVAAEGVEAVATAAEDGTVVNIKTSDAESTNTSTTVVERTSTPEEYCLQASHLLFAWKTCTRKADLAVSAQVYQLLVSILPMCPPKLAIPLLQAVQASLDDPEHTSEVGEFCGALAEGNVFDVSNQKNGGGLDEGVRLEILNLLWAVLTHPEASTMKAYDSIKRYVNFELRNEVKGAPHRERFLESCLLSLRKFVAASVVNEDQALLIVKLTSFIMDACPRQQADALAQHNEGAFPKLIYEELKAYLTRRKIRPTSASTVGSGRGGFRKPPTSSTSSLSVTGNGSGEKSSADQHVTALQERLRILRQVYGYSDPTLGSKDPIVMTADMIKALWTLCAPSDREWMIVFIASASNTGKVNQQDASANGPQQQAPGQAVSSPALTPDACRSVFLDLFCDKDFDFSSVGASGYRSFHYLFSAIRNAPEATLAEKRSALDSQWRLCLRTGTNAVAQKAMQDLLAVYISAIHHKNNNQMMVSTPMATEVAEETESMEEDFCQRIFECLDKVKTDIQNQSSGANRAAERCIRILNAAVGQQIIDVEGAFTNTPSTLMRLSQLPFAASLTEILKCLPHGQRGESACFTVSITARRNPVTHSSQNLQALPDAAPEQARLPATSRFSMELHPLETISSVKSRLAAMCHCELAAVKPLHITGRRANAGDSSANLNLSTMPEDSVMDELGVVHGCEIVVSISDRMQVSMSTPLNRGLTIANDLSGLFFDDDRFTDKLFSVLLELLDLLSVSDESTNMDVDGDPPVANTRQLIWDLLDSMPTNTSILSQVEAIKSTQPGVEDAMEIDSSTEKDWDSLLQSSGLNRAVYVLLTLDALLNPATTALSILPQQSREIVERELVKKTKLFRTYFVETGGFVSVVHFFSREEQPDTSALDSRRGNAVALRILKMCLFSDDEAASGTSLLQSLSSTEGLLKSLTSTVVDDEGVPSSTVLDVLRFLRLLFANTDATKTFIRLPRGLAKRLVTTLLVKDDQEPGTSGRFNTAAVKASAEVRTSVSEMLLQTPVLADICLSWLIEAVQDVKPQSETTLELFATLEKLVADAGATARSQSASDEDLRHLALVVCNKISLCPRPTSEADLVDNSTGVLCGCLRLLRALVEKSSGAILRQGTDLLLNSLAIQRWSTDVDDCSMDDLALLDLMGVLFDGLLTPSESTPVAICCDSDSRREGFGVVTAAAQRCSAGKGYIAIVNYVNGLVKECAPSLRHRWGEFGGVQDSHTRLSRAAKYSGLRNQGCTCYMNSALQQLFMMPELRDSMCDAQLPASLRTSGGSTSKGKELVGRKIAVQWETGVTYDAKVESFDEATNMHIIRYLPIQIATVGGSHQHQQVRPDEIETLPPNLPDEFVLSEGRPGKETGVYEIIQEASGEQVVSSSPEGGTLEKMDDDELQENEDQAASRHLLEEVQRTFIHLAEGSKGRVFDPRALVEACACLKLEFDVWQQNDASEFVTKLLDRMEGSLKKWAPTSFQYLDHTFGFKQTRQKICKECGLKTNKEEKLINIDCQIRGKSDVHEALATMTEADVMEGSNKVSCDRCKKKTDTILRSALSTLPNMLILSLKRFDLDFTTFETVKLNSRCAFGETLNMKPYTIEGIEALEAASTDPAPMDTDVNESDPLAAIPDEDYEYKLAGVLVHAGVAQGGHYYSFIRDRSPEGDEKWYRFDDEDVTPFNPASIETECFGGKVKKETKWPNGQTHTVEQEQYANALMLFYEKVKPTVIPEEDVQTEKKKEDELHITRSNGFDAFKPDVKRTNATHKLQSFLFDPECQSFLQGLLEICRDHTEAEGWKGELLQMLLSYFFDIFLYSADKPDLGKWAAAFEESLGSNAAAALEFVKTLATKTREVAGNWFRTYLVDCPDGHSRSISVEIFASAMISAARVDSEAKLLQGWTSAYTEMAESIYQEQRQNSNSFGPYPRHLEGKWSIFEDLSRLKTNECSALGVLIANINILLEYVHRCWRFSVEPCSLIRALAIATPTDGDYLFRKPMVESMVPARLIGFICRGQAPRVICAAFPGVCLTTEAANSQIRSESSPQQIMPIGSNQLSSEIKVNRSPTHRDFLSMLEAFAFLAGIPGGPTVQVAYEARDSSSLDRVQLSYDAKEAFSIVFKELCLATPNGMTQQEVELYLKKTCADVSAQSHQKIADMMTKYQTVVANNSRAPLLTLDGFLAYYQDLVQGNENKAISDLHTLGFRSDLSRRSAAARLVSVNGRETERKAAESVAIDLSEHWDKALDIGMIASHCLKHTPQLFRLAFECNESLAEYLVAAAAYKRDCDPIIFDALQTIHRMNNDWNGNVRVNTAIRALCVIASVPDENQEKRISYILECSQPPQQRADYGAGILQVLRKTHRDHQQRHYNNESNWGFERYMGALKELRRLYSVYKWMNNNRDPWAFLERELHDTRSVGHYQQQTGHYHHQPESSSFTYDVRGDAMDDMNADSGMTGIHESEDEDEDSQCDHADGYQQRQGNSGPYQIKIEGAGTEQVNGVYSQDGYFEGACKYSRQGLWNGVTDRFYIFQCNVSNNTKHWYISIIPSGGNPGTSADIDFYTAPVNKECEQVPPENTWIKGPEGKDPVPSLHFSRRPEQSEESENVDGGKWMDRSVI